MTMIEGLPLVGIAAVLWSLRPAGQAAPEPTPEPGIARGVR